MKTQWTRTAAGAACLALSLTSGIASARPTASSAVDATKHLLRAYVAGDARTIAALADPGVTVYGSDLAEIVRGRPALLRMMSDDRRLWGTAARFGAMRDLSVVATDDLTSLVFDAPFRVRRGSDTIVRFSMVWRAEDGAWRLIQSSNGVPTRGRSARELLAGGSAGPAP